MPELYSEFLFTIRIAVDELHDFGNTPFGTRHVDMLGEGSFEGPKLTGTVLGGMDQKVFRSDGAMNPNVRLVLKTEDDALIYMYYTGVRHGSKEGMERSQKVSPSIHPSIISAIHHISKHRHHSTIG